MWGTILGIVVKYWVEFLLGLVVLGGTAFIKRYMKLEKESRERDQKEYYKKLTEDIFARNNEMIQEVKEMSQAGDAKLQQEIDALAQQNKELKQQNETMTAGVLSIQGKEFKANCRKLLEPSHVISLEEWEEICEDHRVYNALGGNHKGDELFSLVDQKFTNTVTK